MYATRQPYQVYTDKSGKPLDNGKLYFGLANQDPETYPQAVFWDAAGTIPAAQPIRTLGGYPVYNGTPAIVYCNNFYSVTSRDQNNVFQYTFPDSSVYDTPTSVAGSNVFSARNLLINASFNVNQRAYVSGTNTTVASQYTLDRWAVIVSGQNITFSADGADFAVIAPAGGLQQAIEGSMIAGGVYTISWEGTASCQINGTTVTKGQNITLPANTIAYVRFIGGTVVRPQLEKSPSATQFDRRFFSNELIFCRRYYETCPIGAGGIWSGSTSSGITTARIPVRYNVDKRATPTVLAINNLGRNGFPNAIPVLENSSVYGFSCYLIANASVGDGYLFINWGADCEL